MPVKQKNNLLGYYLLFGEPEEVLLTVLSFLIKLPKRQGLIKWI